MKNEELVKQLTSPSKNSRLEKFGKTITFLCLALIVFIVAMILLFVAQKGLATFFVNKVSLIEFLFSGGKCLEESAYVPVFFAGRDKAFRFAVGHFRQQVVIEREVWSPVYQF